MIGKLYRKLYLYAIFIILTSIILTTTIVSAIFQTNEKKFFRNHFIKEAVFIQKFLSQIERDNPKKLKSNIKDISKSLRWQVSYWKDGENVYYTGKKVSNPSKNDIDTLAKTKDVVVLNEMKPPVEFLLYLDPAKPEKGYLIMSMVFRQNNNDRVLSPPATTGLLALLILALLLIPYTLYIVNPFKKIMISINKIAKGDFSTRIDVSKKSEFRELADAFNNMTFKVQEMITQKQRLIADVSHELRSPLTRMRLGLEILSKDPEGRKRYIDKSIMEIEQLNKLIEDILSASKIELDDKNIVLSSVNLKDLVSDNLEKHQLIFDKHRISVNKIFPENNISIKLEKNLMERALDNIFSNTVKYSPENSSVDISITYSDKMAFLSITDKGPGVKESDQEKIFEPFYRTDDSRTRKTGGTGLGLSIVKKIIDLHKGKIYARKPQGNEGLEICIELPIN